MDLIKINAAEYGLEKTKANELTVGLDVTLKERKLLIDEFDTLSKLEVNEGNNVPKFRGLRLRIAKNRTLGILKWHKTAKNYFLRGGQFVDAIKKQEMAVNELMEEKLMNAENHFENERTAKIAKLQEERAEKIGKYIEVIPETLGLMKDDIWDNFFSGTKVNHKAMKEAEKKAERQRIDREKAEREKKKLIIAENEWLKKKAEERDAKIRAEGEQRARDEAERLKRENEERTKREQKIKIQKAEFAAQLQKEREERERIEKEAEAKRKKLEAELREKIEVEKNRKQAIEDARQAYLNKGDAEKVKDLVNDLKGLGVKYKFQSAKNRKMYTEVGTLLNKVIIHIIK